MKITSKKIYKSLTNRIDIFLDSIKNILSNSKFFYITENADWIIREIGSNLIENIDASMVLTRSDYFIRNSIIHYGSVNIFLKKNFRVPHRSNKVIVSIYHVNEGDQRLGNIIEIDNYVHKWVTASTLTEKKLIEFGISPNKIQILPLGIDFKDFMRIGLNYNKSKVLSKYSIPKGKLLIGSFQKDGNGWEGGDSPKLIKGPDILCDVLEKLKLKIDFCVVLTGPSRGYVKNRLRNSGIEFIHNELKDRNQIIELFHALDLYLITSRVEGGPYAVLESFASKTLLVTTKVGIANDLVVNHKNGVIVEKFDSNEIATATYELLLKTKIHKKLLENAIDTVKRFDWGIVGKDFETLYLSMQNNED